MDIKAAGNKLILFIPALVLNIDTVNFFEWNKKIAIISSQRIGEMVLPAKRIETATTKWQQF
jgi:hypothetical protein